MQDLLAAIGHTKHGNNVAQQHRKTASFASRIAGLVSSSSEVNWIKSMTPVERHAELMYAETLFATRSMVRPMSTPPTPIHGLGEAGIARVRLCQPPMPLYNN